MALKVLILCGKNYWLVYLIIKTPEFPEPRYSRSSLDSPLSLRVKTKTKESSLLILEKLIPISTGEPDGIGDYVANSDEALTPCGYEKGIENFRNPYRTHEFTWGIGEVVTALLEAGLILEVLKEYPYTNGCKIFERMREVGGRRMMQPEDVPNLPLMYAIAARKP